MPFMKLRADINIWWAEKAYWQPSWHISFYPGGLSGLRISLKVIGAPSSLAHYYYYYYYYHHHHHLLYAGYLNLYS
jgi:hypothetical protein